jgi:SUMO ligase MMS21 Smc5/6 complex component
MLVDSCGTAIFGCILDLLRGFVCQSSPNTQTAISQLLFVRLTPSLHHSSSVCSLQVFLCTVHGFGAAIFGCILVLLCCFVCQSYPKYSNCHISASTCPFDPSLHHSSSVCSLQVFLCIVDSFGTARFGCILDLLHGFMC